MNGVYDELRLALHAIWTRRWIALATAWGICVLGWLIVSQIPNSYQSKAKLAVDSQTMLPDQQVQGQIAQQKASDDVRQTLASAVNLQKVVRGSDLAGTVSNDRDVADRVAMLQKAIKVTTTPDNLFEVSTTLAMPGRSDAGNAKLAHDVTQKLIEVFIQGNIAGDRSQTTQTLSFLDQQLAKRQQQLQSAENQRSEFQSRYLGMLPGTGSLDDRIGAARQKLSQIDSDLAAASSSLAAVNGQMSGTARSTPGGASVAAGPAHARVAAIMGQIADARARGFTDQHPDIIALKSQLAQAQAAAKGEPLGAAAAGADNPLYVSLKSMQADKSAQVAALQMQKGQIQGDLNRLNEKLASDPGAASQQAQIDRSFQTLQDQYNKLLADREQVALQSQAQTQTDALRFTVTDPPTMPRTPSAPNRPLLLTGVLILGLIGGIGAAFALGQLRATFPVASKLEAASGLPVIGAIGEMVTKIEQERRAKRMKAFAGGAAALGVAFVALLALEFIQRGMIA